LIFLLLQAVVEEALPPPVLFVLERVVVQVVTEHLQAHQEVVLQTNLLSH
jgi:hypothetical protein